MFPAAHRLAGAQIAQRAEGAGAERGPRPIAGGAAEEGGSERSFPGGRSSADLRVHRKSSDEASGPPPRMRKPAMTLRTGAG